MGCRRGGRRGAGPWASPLGVPAAPSGAGPAPHPDQEQGQEQGGHIGPGPGTSAPGEVAEGIRGWVGGGATPGTRGGDRSWRPRDMKAPPDGSSAPERKGFADRSKVGAPGNAGEWGLNIDWF